VKVSCGVAPWKVMEASNCRVVGAAKAEVVRRARVAVMVESFMLRRRCGRLVLGEYMENAIEVLKVG